MGAEELLPVIDLLSVAFEVLPLAVPSPEVRTDDDVEERTKAGRMRKSLVNRLYRRGEFTLRSVRSV